MRFDFIGVMECLTSDGCRRRNILFQGEACKNVACSERCVQLIFCCNVCMYTFKVNFVLMRKKQYYILWTYIQYFILLIFYLKN
jgi:hypothetical protein